jgi:hypothetical protein
MKIEIEIPDPPEGWVYEAIRQGTPGEKIWSGVVNGWQDCWICTTYSYPVAVKVKPLWEPSPELLAVLRTGWIARDEPGGWYWYTRRPKQDSRMWLGENKSLGATKQSLLPPDSIPWDKSLFQIGDPKE